jgi:glycosyltransferase involved in cell wall biosynthesis
VVLESWSAQYPSFLYPGQQTISVPEGEPFGNTRRALSWKRPDGWFKAGRRLRSYDLVVLTVLSPVQVPAYLGILAGLKGPRVIALCHNVLPHETKPYDRPLMRALLKRVGGVLVHTADQAVVAQALTTATVTVAEMPAHMPGAAGDAHPDEVFRRLLFFGMVRPYKGLDVLLRALPKDVALTVAGEFWSGLDETRALIAELGLNVDLRPGYVPAEQIAGLFAEADALVLPYRSATASQNAQMAFEYGIPVIATRVGGFPDQVRDGVDGLLADPDDVASLNAALTHFYADPAKFRAEVRKPDAEPVWADYLKALTHA